MVEDEGETAGDYVGSPRSDVEFDLNLFETGPGQIQREVTPEAFDSWYRERQHARNIREGTPYFNGPGRISLPTRHSPSRLLQCKRKSLYRQLKSPEENEDPDGIFWIGTRIEEELIQPFIADQIAHDDEYVSNSTWVDFTVESSVGSLRIKGSTDPVIVDAEAEPILPFEVKTKDKIDHLSQPNSHHNAQLHAYMKGLTESSERPVTRGVILYVDRTNLDIRSFPVRFDEDFWYHTIVPWMAQVSEYRSDQELPPANPEHDWECKFCSYKERCGMGDRMFSDEPPLGFLPLTSYPQDKVLDHLKIHPDTVLTPTLANQYPTLAVDYEVADWTCSGCGSSFRWDRFDWDCNTSDPIKCPKCLERGSTRFLSGPLPDEQHPNWPSNDE